MFASLILTTVATAVAFEPTEGTEVLLFDRSGQTLLGYGRILGGTLRLELTGLNDGEESPRFLMVVAAPDGEVQTMPGRVNAAGELVVEHDDSELQELVSLLAEESVRLEVYRVPEPVVADEPGGAQRGDPDAAPGVAGGGQGEGEGQGARGGQGEGSSKSPVGAGGAEHPAPAAPAGDDARPANEGRGNRANEGRREDRSPGGDPPGRTDELPGRPDGAPGRSNADGAPGRSRSNEPAGRSGRGEPQGRSGEDEPAGRSESEDQPGRSQDGGNGGQGAGKDSSPDGNGPPNDGKGKRDGR